MGSPSTTSIVRLALYLNRYSDLVKKAKPFIDNEGSERASQLLEDIETLEAEIRAWRESLSARNRADRRSK